MHADIQRSYLKNHIMPYFGNMRLSNIKPGDVEDWIGHMLKRGKSASLINHCLRTVKRLPETKKQQALLTLVEVERLFDESNFDQFWHGNMIHYTLYLVAASTGRRMAEIQALQDGNIYPGYIRVTQSWTCKYGLVHDSRTKRHVRDVPIPKKTEVYVQLTLAARDHGIGSCRIATFSIQKIREVLDIPARIRVKLLMTLGYPETWPEKRPKKEYRDLFCFDRYRE